MNGYKNLFSSLQEHKGNVDAEWGRKIHLDCFWSLAILSSGYFLFKNIHHNVIQLDTESFFMSGHTRADNLQRKLFLFLGLASLDQCGLWGCFRKQARGEAGPQKLCKPQMAMETTYQIRGNFGGVGNFTKRGSPWAHRDWRLQWPMSCQLFHK